MKTFAFVAVALKAALTLSACKREVSWHQRLTVTVDTPKGEVGAVSVTEVAWFGPNKLFLRDLDGGGLSAARRRWPR